MRTPDRASEITRVAIYTRASRTFAHRPGVTMQQQEETCRAEAARHGWIVIAVYADESKSAYKDDLSKRTAFQRMLLDAKAKHFDRVLVYKLDRFARRVIVQYQAAAELEKYHVDIASATEHIERKTAAGKMTFGMLAVMAETYSALHGERMRDTREAEARSGQLPGPPPFGLRRVNRKIEHSPDAPIVLDIFTRRSQGYSLQTIVRQLAAEGALMDGRPFHVHNLKQILKNRIYIGVVTCGEQTYPASFPPIVPLTLWEQVRALMAQKYSTRIARTARTPSTLGNLGYCANCGARLHYVKDSRRSIPYEYYYCSARREGGYCNAASNHVGVIDQQLIAIVQQLGSTPGDVLEKALDMFETGQRSAPRAVVDRSQVEEQIRRIARAYGDGAYTEAEYHAKRSSLIASLEDAPPPPPPPIDITALAARLGDIGRLVEQATVEDRHALLCQLFAQVYARPTPADRKGVVIAVRPTQFFAPLLVNIASSCIDSGSAYPRKFATHAYLPLILDWNEAIRA